MPSGSDQLIKTDLRVQKTERALIKSMLSLLSQCRFAKLTVERICKEAQFSRATFYSHFADKYDALAFWLHSFWTFKESKAGTYEDIEAPINQFTYENKKIIRNLLMDADPQTLEILQDFLCSALDIDRAMRIDGKAAQKNIVAANLYVGGIINYLSWQVRNNFPPDVPVINQHSFEAIHKLQDWARGQ